MGRQNISSRFTGGTKRPLLPAENDLVDHVCAVCKFVAIDGPGLQMHLVDSPTCVRRTDSQPAALQLDEESPFLKMR